MSNSKAILPNNETKNKILVRWNSKMFSEVLNDLIYFIIIESFKC